MPKSTIRISKLSDVRGRVTYISNHAKQEIDILKIGLSGIVKRNGYKNVQEFYKIYHKSHGAYTAYKEQETKWEKIHGTDSQKQDKESIHERLKNPSKKTTDYQQQMTVKGKDRRAR